MKILVVRLDGDRPTVRHTTYLRGPGSIDRDLDKKNCLESGGRTLEKLRKMREANGLELDQEEVEPTIGRKLKTKFEIPNEYSENILITDSDFILSDRSSAAWITADMSFQTKLDADFLERLPKYGISVQTVHDWEAWRHFLLQLHRFLASTYAFW